MSYIKNPFTLLLISAIISIAVLLTINASVQQKNIADNVLRLHITADSNSPYDQLVKLSVRDYILKNYGFIFSDCSSFDKAKEIAEKYTDQIQKDVSNELEKFSKTYPVSVAVKECSFPIKNYGDLTLPAGRYTALNITLGSGRGRNWWCVMYPPLCLVPGTVVTENKALDNLKANLSPQEYEFITDSDSINIKMKFKITEIIERLR